MYSSNIFLIRILIVFATPLFWFITVAQPNTDTSKRMAIIKTARLYKGVTIENITPTTDHKGAVVKTIDGKTYFLNREQAKQDLDLTITDGGFIAPKDASIIYYDQNGVPSESYFNDVYAGTKSLYSPLRGKGFFIREKGAFNDADSLNKPLYVIDGKEASKEEMASINPINIESVNILKGAEAIAAYGNKGRDGVIVIITKKPAADTIAVKVDKGASFPGGITAWRRYIEHNLNYPRTAQQNNTQGTVRVQLLVDKNGKIKEAIALNDPGDGLAAEAVRVVKSGPDWIPAMQNGQPVTYSFVQTITFQLGAGKGAPSTAYIPANTNRYNQSIVIKSPRWYNGNAIEYIIPTFDGKGADVMMADRKSYFISRDEAVQQFGLVITEKGFVAPEDATVLYIDNNGVKSDNYKGLKFVGGKRQPSFRTLFGTGAQSLDSEKLPLLVLNGKEVEAAEVQLLKPNEIRGLNLLKFQDEAALAKFGNKGKNGILMLSTKLAFPDNYLYLLNDKETTNEEIARLPPGTIKRMNTTTGGRGFEKYGLKATFGVVAVDTNTIQRSYKTDTIFLKTLNATTFPGGTDAWKKYVTEHLRYPEVALKNKTEGTVRVGITVSPNGMVTQVLAYNVPADGLAEEAVRLVKEGPQWTPAKQNGINVAYRVIIPVTFKIDATKYL